jgi:hypothetical protein
MDEIVRLVVLTGGLLAIMPVLLVVTLVDRAALSAEKNPPAGPRHA